MPRPSKFTPEVRSKIVQALRGGNPMKYAAGFAGVSETTTRKWLMLAEQPEAPPEYQDWLAEVEKAKADAVVIRMARISKAAAGGAWQADIAILERTHPEDFGKVDRSKIELSGPDGGPLTIQHQSGADTESIIRLEALLNHRVAERQDPLSPPAIDTSGHELPKADPEAFRIQPGELGAGSPSLETKRSPGPLQSPVSPDPDIAEFQERKQAHEAVQRTEEAFQEIVADIPDAWSWDQDPPDDGAAWDRAPDPE